MIVLYRFRLFRAFAHYELFCFFPFSLISAAKYELNQPSCYYFIKITCNNKCYAQITMGVADYSKRQLKTIRFPISRAPI